MGKLSELALKHGSDKWGHHYYTEHYEKTLEHLKDKHFNLLEIGIGGYEYPDRGGASLNMWAEFFPLAHVIGFDFYDKSYIHKIAEDIRTVKGDQSSNDDLIKLNTIHGPFHVIIDDGSHMCAHQIKSFEVLFPLMPDGGIYIIEDTETSYWKYYGGTMVLDIIEKKTCIGYFMNKIHEMMYRTNGTVKQEPYTDIIESIQFYNNIIIIRKGYNS